MTVVAVARTSVMIAAYPMIACRPSSVITPEALTISAMSSHATCMPTSMSAAVATATTMTATTTTTFGIGGTNRGDIGRQKCRHPECQSTSKDSNQGFSHFYSPPEARGGS